MRWHRVLVAAVVVTVFCIAISLAGDKRKTEVWTQTVSTPDDWPTVVLADCGDYQVLQDFAGIWRFIAHYNERGNAVDVQWHTRLLESWVYNSENPEIWVPSQTGGIERDRYDFENGWLYFTLSARVKVPGEGMVMRETGRAVLNLATGEIVVNTGHNDFLGGDTAAICEAFAP